MFVFSIIVSHINPFVNKNMGFSRILVLRWSNEFKTWRKINGINV